ncbi:substrate-binding periplasmic protein [Amphritea balenae]|nr:transporter substrate-binding domain-containing protein [Amphritea balenae]
MRKTSLRAIGCLARYWLMICAGVWIGLPAGAVNAETLRVGMPLPGQIPFFWRDDSGRYQGIYADTLRAVAAETGIEFEFIALSQARLRRHFIGQEIDIEVGVSTNLVEPEPLQQASLYSRPFGIANEVIIYSPELSFPVFILNDLKGIRVATVRGTAVPDSLIREDFSNAWQIAQRVHRGWNKIGLMKEAIAIHYQRDEHLNYQISLPYSSNPVHIRLHRSRQPFLAQINQSLKLLEERGTLDQIVCKYLCGQPATE